MIENTLIIGFILMVLCIISFTGWVVSYQHEGTLWQILFGTLMCLSVTGFGICFVAAIVLLITGG